MMKRSREEFGGSLDRTIAMANYLLLLSRGTTTTHTVVPQPARVFECKTCNRQFPSFQALGGHRASHKKPKLMAEGVSTDQSEGENGKKPKTHECSICGQEFAIGQALGGHMRRHRAEMYGNDGGHVALPLSLSLGPTKTHDESRERPVVKKANGGGRVTLCLDLNLSPPENELDIGKVAAIFG